MLQKFVLLAAFAVSIAYSQVVVTIPDGQISGREDSTYQGNVFYAFQEIPYAKPPVGELRFKPPELIEPWSGVLDATTNTKTCYQMSNAAFTETEDCLYVNVYTPVDPSSGSNASLPVMFYIYGGGFLNGDAVYDHYGPHYFIDQGVVVVTVNYRIGPFGFLSTGDLVVPGNMGLKDQNLGLQWVQNNIEIFGGDPTKVTIFGLSAGAASVTYQMLSEKSKGLFRAAIAESGSALCPWAYQRGAKDVAYLMATNIDASFSTSSTSEEVLALLQSVTPEEIIASTSNFPWAIGRDQLVQGFQYAPVVEPDHDGAFLTKRMYDVVSSGSVSTVPLLIGIASEEQLERGKDLDGLNWQLTQYDLDLGALVNDNMHVTNTETRAVVGDSIRKIYTTGQLQDDVAAAIHYFSDTSFSRPIIHHATLHSAFSDVYFYQFSYHGDQVTWIDVNIEGCGRVTHGEDNAYLWGYNNNGNIEEWGTTGDIDATNRYVQFFANFAKYLNPTPEENELFQNIIWPKVTPDNFQYLDIDADLTVKTDPKSPAYAKWVELYESMAAKPYDTF